MENLRLLGEKDDSLPTISRGNKGESRGTDVKLAQSLWLFHGAKRTQKEPLLKAHSVFPPLLASPGPVPVIIGRSGFSGIGTNTVKSVPTINVAD